MSSKGVDPFKLKAMCSSDSEQTSDTLVGDDLSQKKIKDATENYKFAAEIKTLVNQPSWLVVGFDK